MHCRESQCSLDVGLSDWRWLIDVVLVLEAKRRFYTKAEGHARLLKQMRGSHSILSEPPASGSVLVILLPPHTQFRSVAADSQFIQKG